MSVSKYRYHEDGTSPSGGQIFVFGSNMAGAHGAGAAKVAADRYGAIMGIGIGSMGQSFGIPTKDKYIKTIPVGDIKIFVDLFVQYALVYEDQEFFVTRIGCGLAGYEDKDIAPMFKNSPPNCNFAEEWREYLED